MEGHSITYDKNRVINFSDAVFSIAMTLLVLEVAVPSAKELNTRGAWVSLSYRIPDFIGLLVSFLVSALYWVAHLRLMKYVSNVDGKLLWLNIFLLLFVVLLPFSTAFYVGGFGLRDPFVFYSLNISVIGFFNLLMIRYVYKSEQEKTGFTKLYYDWYKWRGINGLVIWLLAAITSFIFLEIARFIFIFIFVIQFFMDRFFKKKLQKQLL